MNAVIMGGDRRFVRLAMLLQADGHGVFPMAMEKALDVQGPPFYGGTDAVILPLPAQKEGRLFAPLSCGEYYAEELLGAFPAGTRVFAGMAGESLKAECRQRGLILHDYFLREEFQVKNALLTAEGALGLLLGLDGGRLMGRRALILGFGRIGRLLAPRLMAMGMKVGVMARSPSQRAWAEAMGCDALRFGESPEGYDFVLNTVAAPVFFEEDMRRARGAALIELASAPGGFCPLGARKLSRNIINGGGLPGRWAEDAAAEAIRDTVYNILEE